MIYNRGNVVDVPSIDVLTFLFESRHCAAVESTPLHAEADDPAHVITKAQARTLSKQFAFFLRRQYGIGKEGPSRDVVLTVSLGQSILPCFFFGVVAAEGIYSAGSAAATPSELARQIQDGPAKLLVCSKEVRELAVAAAKIAGLPLTNVLVLESRPVPKLDSVEGDIQCNFTRELPWPIITNQLELENTTICILYSSGTTGLPKGVKISHANMVAECFLPAAVNRPIWRRWDAVDGRPFESRTLGHLPAAHIAGLQGYFINPFYDGGIVYWMPKFDFAQFLIYNSALRITTFFSVPPIYLGIAKHPMVKGQFASLRIAYSGAAPLSSELQAAASARLGGGKTLISQTWGSSETTGAVTHLAPDRTDLTGGVGSLLPNTLMRLVDDMDQDVRPGGAGEALLKGPMITKGYHNNPEANAATFTADGWMRTGDILKVEGDLLYVVDRKKELIKYKGLQIAPAELEGVLLTHPAIGDAAVIGVNGEGTELPRAYVVPVPQYQGKLSADEVVRYVKDRVASHKQLRGGVVFLGAIPRGPSGKILRKDLREMAKVMGTAML